jgi:hypothetical protein
LKTPHHTHPLPILIKKPRKSIPFCPNSLKDDNIQSLPTASDQQFIAKGRMDEAPTPNNTEFNMVLSPQ